MIHIQRATVQDIDTLIDFQQRLASESEGVTLNGEVLRKGLQALFADPNKGFYFVAKENTEVIGCHMITFEWSDWRNGMVWWIQSVYTVPEFRRRGIYAALYGHIRAKVADDPNIRGIRLYVDNRNKPAQEVYARLGMEGEHYRVFEWMK